jgi:hypothetical protein
MTVCALAEQRFANHADGDARRRCLDCRAQSRTAGADHQHVMLVSRVVGHYQNIRTSFQIPIEQSRT